MVETSSEESLGYTALAKKSVIIKENGTSELASRGLEHFMKGYQKGWGGWGGRAEGGRGGGGGGGYLRSPGAKEFQKRTKKPLPHPSFTRQQGATSGRENTSGKLNWRHFGK